jgi:hypothetical protein
MPRLAYGLATRARRPRPSEKIALRVIPGFSPQGRLTLAGPPRRGGLCTPVTTAQRQPKCCLPWATGSSSTHVVEMECLGASSALPCGRTECVPPRKTPLALSPGYPRKAILARIAHPPEGRAPHARKESITLTPTCFLSAIGSSLTHSVGMESFGLRVALPPWRKDRAPPKKPAPSALSGLTAQGRFHGLASGPVFRTGEAHFSKKTPTTRMGGYFRKRSPHAPCAAVSMNPRTPRSPSAGTKKGGLSRPPFIRAIEPYGYLV